MSIQKFDPKKKSNKFNKKIREFSRNDINLEVIELLRAVSSQSKYILEFEFELDNSKIFIIEPLETVSHNFFSLK